jgi:hypothetical protein
MNPFHIIQFKTSVSVLEPFKWSFDYLAFRLALLSLCGGVTVIAAAAYASVMWWGERHVNICMDILLHDSCVTKMSGGN